eukprot:CAMPEP_0113446828 /NCGR_PEP_ID=MMETSP0014_2-20120614/3920_1 /TAXON_ID=2857 /ORGANISM="Nitzschia sp." /LENGTH=759 /DNA_ID=CAMNT_0000337957 /DNA_START=187 /DNA_END=2466 /DNA_ORIENTATION=- /assembly_acc=CAM_ASM_000159
MVSLKSLDMLDMPPEHVVDGVVSNLEATIPSVAAAAAAAAGSSSSSGGNCGKSDHKPEHGHMTLITVTVPSLSLFNNQEDCDNGASTSNTALSRDEIQLQTAECMSRPIRFDMKNKKKKKMDDEVKECSVAAKLKQQRSESETEALAIQSAATQMLEGCIETMDQLVDARLSAYSKILRQHYNSKKYGNANDHDEDDTNNHNNDNNVVDFKLRTLLGLGTNISFDSILLNVRTDPGSESRMPTRPQVQKQSQEQKELDVNQTRKTSMEKPIVLEVVMNGLSVGGDKQQQQQEEEEEEQCEGKDSIKNNNSNHGNNDNDDTNRHLQQHVIRLEAPGIVLVQKIDEKNEEVTVETETEANEGNTNAGDLCNVSASATPDETNDADNCSVLQLLDTPSRRTSHAIHGLRKQMQEQMQEHHAPCTFQEGEETRHEQQHLESALGTRPTVSAVITSNHTDNRENCEEGNHKQQQSTGQHAALEESPNCSYSLTVQVDTTKLLAGMMDEAEKIVGRVVEITNDAWNQQDQDQDQARKNPEAGAEAETVGLAAAASSSSISPKLGAKTVSEASFVPLNMAIMDRKHAAELEEEGEREAHEAPAEDKQSIAAGVSAASAVAAAAAHLPPPPPPPESPNSSTIGSKKRSLPGYADSNNDNMENYSPIDPAAAERASHIVDFVFGEIEFVTPPPLVSPSNTSSSGSTFRLSPVRKKIKHSATAESPSPLCLSSVPSQPPPPAAALPPVPSLPATNTTSTSSIRTGNSTN